MNSCTHNSSPGGRDTKRGVRGIYTNTKGVFTLILATEHNPYKEEAFPFRNPEGT